MAQHKVLLLEDMDPRGIDYLRQHAEVAFAYALDEDALVRQVADIDGMVIRANGKITRRVMEAASRLIVIGRHGVGLDTVDLPAATELGVQVVNTPHATTEAVAEHAVAMMLALAKQMVRADCALRQGQWNVRHEYIGFELKGRTLGVVGIGRIGYRVAEICKILGMTILYADMIQSPAAEGTLGAHKVTLEELLRSSDVVSLHAPLTAQTRQMIGAQQLDMMKPTAILINAARGEIVDGEALLEALTNRRIAGAGLDVFDPEPLPADSPFFALDNVFLTPHMASHTADAMYKMAMVAEDVVAVLQGKEPQHPANQPTHPRR